MLKAIIDYVETLDLEGCANELIHWKRAEDAQEGTDYAALCAVAVDMLGVRIAKLYAIRRGETCDN